ncbi:MAG TPA: MATE family efflux transporter, partial [Tepidisphaeraceae bacterium]|nr:MATE family efflux transporter [Tepidisphaeraceae bacterium]
PHPDSHAGVARSLLALSLPVLAEHLLHMLVGINDTYLANHLPSHSADAAAAVGTISSFIWFLGLLCAAVGTGSTAIIARATGAKHRRLSNNVTGQSVSSAVVIGIALALLLFFLAKPASILTGLSPTAVGFAYSYLRLLAPSVPFMMLMLIANACLRGAGDTLTPAIVMIIVDIVNVIFSWGLTYGYWHLPNLGFNGIAAGTTIAYIAGGVIQLAVLLSGAGRAKLFPHRLTPHWHTLKRLLRIGLPSGLENLLGWGAQFIVLIIINTLDPTSRMPAAHRNAVVIESASYLVGFAFATAAATMVGQSLGMKDPRRAARSAYAAYAFAGSFMTLMGLFFIFFGKYPSQWMSPDPYIQHLTTKCLFITGFCQSGFAASLIFSGSLRGAGDTLAAMLLNLSSILSIRLLGALIVGYYLRLSLPAIWIVLSAELFTRGLLIYGRFVQGKWRHTEV